MTERCPHCGVKLDAGSAKCGFCGAPLDVPYGEPPQFPPIPALYDRGHVLWISFFFTPAFGSWCSWRNAKALENKRMEKVALVSIPIFVLFWIVSAVVIFFGILPNIDPDSAEHVRVIIALINLIPWIGYYFVVHKPLADHIKKNDITCRKKSCVRPVLVALVLNIAAAAVLFGIMISADS